MNVLTIAAQTFTEARRNRVFYSLFLFALVVVLSSVIFTEVTSTTDGPRAQGHRAWRRSTSSPWPSRSSPEWASSTGRSTGGASTPCSPSR